jgi:hypothetical protein
VALATRALVGRAETCSVRLQSLRASGEHAVLFWSGGAWSVRDLGSTNGTSASGRKLGVGERAVLAAGAELVFADESERWTFVEVGAPSIRARSVVTGAVRVPEHGVLALPDASDPRITIFEDEAGHWVLESEGEARPASDEERIEAGGAWVLHVPRGEGSGEVPTTLSQAAGAKLVRTIGFRFEVSRDGEHVALALRQAGIETRLGARAHHDLLLVLARARALDRTTGVAPSERGWMYVDDLLQELGVDLQHLNVLVLRARQQLGSAGVTDVGALFERRLSTRQIRLGTDAVEIAAA